MVFYPNANGADFYCKPVQEKELKGKRKKTGTASLSFKLRNRGGKNLETGLTSLMA